MCEKCHGDPKVGDLIKIHNFGTWVRLRLFKDTQHLSVPGFTPHIVGIMTEKDVATIVDIETVTKVTPETDTVSTDRMINVMTSSGLLGWTFIEYVEKVK